MNGYLLDTGVALVAVSALESLPARVRRGIERRSAFLSVVAYWEVMIKSMKGTLDAGNPQEWFDHTIEALALRPLLFRPEHVTKLSSLPPIHQDPFDRAMIAQSIAEDLTLLTIDGIIPQYATATLDFRAILR